MSAVPPPLAAAAARHPAAARAVARAAGLARVSSIIMLVLGGASLLVCVRAPLSAGFAISVAVLINGWIEHRLGRRLAAHDHAAPARLALNQLALGLAVMAYAAWQAHAIGPEQIDAVLRRPFVAQVLAELDPAVVHPMLERLPLAVGVVYWIVGGGTFLGCAATAVYYFSKSRALRVLAGQS